MADFYQGVAATIPLPAGYTAIKSASRDGQDFTPVGTITFTAGGAAWWQATASDMGARVLHLVLSGAGMPPADVIMTTETEYTVARALDLDATAAGVVQLNGKLMAGLPSLTVVQPVDADGSTLHLIRGNSYSPDGREGQQLAITCSLVGQPTDLPAATFTIDLPGIGLTGLPVLVTVNSETQTVTFSVALTVDQTNTLYVGTAGTYAIHATWDAEHRTDLVHKGDCYVS